MAEVEGYLKQNQEALKTAEDKDKAQIEENIAALEKEREAFPESEGYWALSPKTIENYRSFDNQWNVVTFNPLTSGSSNENTLFFDTTIAGYLEGTLTVDELIKQLDDKVMMIEMEGE